jgi:hypothetical protein
MVSAIGCKENFAHCYANLTRLLWSSDSISSSARPNQKRIVFVHQRAIVDAYGLVSRLIPAARTLPGWGDFFVNQEEPAHGGLHWRPARKDPTRLRVIKGSPDAMDLK